MGEEVNTGGLTKFRYNDSDKPELNDNERNEIRTAYAKADERKRQEKRNRILLWVIIGLIAIGIGLYFILK